MSKLKTLKDTGNGYTIEPNSNLDWTQTPLKLTEEQSDMLNDVMKKIIDNLVQKGITTAISYHKKELREEAQKWIIAYAEACSGTGDWPQLLKDEGIGYIVDTDDFIKYFFDLSEEELQ